MTNKVNYGDELYICKSAPKWSSIHIPQPKWQVQIPKGGHSLMVNYSELTLWQRMGMRFIGWGVTKIKEQDSE